MSTDELKTIANKRTFSDYSRGLDYILSLNEPSPYKWYRLEGNVLYAIR